MWKTRPFLRARLAVYGVFFFATIGFYSTFILWLGANDDTVAQLLIIAAAVVLILLARRYLGRYLTYSGHVPHLEAMASALKGKTLPKGHLQIEELTRQVDRQYPEAGRLVQLERLIVRALRDARDLADDAKEPAPVATKPPPLHRVRKLVHNLALRRFADAVFAYAVYVGKPNLWRSARDGIALYAESADKLNKTANRVYVVGLVTWLVLAVPLLLATWSIFVWANTHGLPTLIIVSTGLLAAAWVVKTALYNPVAAAWMLSAILRRRDELGGADEEWAERLERSSKRFGELNDRAKAFAQQTSGEPPERPPEAPPSAPSDGDTPPAEPE